jgi:hypothetical protein
LDASFPAPRLSHIPFAGDIKTVNNAPPLFITPGCQRDVIQVNGPCMITEKEVKSVAFLSYGEIVFLLLVTELL